MYPTSCLTVFPCVICTNCKEYFNSEKEREKVKGWWEANEHNLLVMCGYRWCSYDFSRGGELAFFSFLCVWGGGGGGGTSFSLSVWLTLSMIFVGACASQPPPPPQYLCPLHGEYKVLIEEFPLVSVRTYSSGSLICTEHQKKRCFFRSTLKSTAWKLIICVFVSNGQISYNTVEPRYKAVGYNKTLL